MRATQSTFGFHQKNLGLSTYNLLQATLQITPACKLPLPVTRDNRPCIERRLVTGSSILEYLNTKIFENFNTSKLEYLLKINLNT